MKFVLVILLYDASNKKIENSEELEQTLGLIKLRT